MNLIEQLGGYEKANAEYKGVKHLRDSAEVERGRVVFAIGILRQDLLEYRRQHNIFEVGENVVCKYEHTHLFGDVVLEIAYFRDDLKDLGRFVRFTNGNDFKLDALRHATDAEIKVGRRLLGAKPSIRACSPLSKS